MRKKNQDQEDSKSEKKSFTKKSAEGDKFSFKGKSEKRNKSFKPKSGEKGDKKFSFKGKSEDRNRTYKPKSGDEDKKPFFKGKSEDRNRTYKPKFGGDDERKSSYKGKSDFKPKFNPSKNKFPKKSGGNFKDPKESGKETSRLNKYIANTGLCSRRDADKLIESGKISVNGQIVTDFSYQVKPKDIVKYNDKRLMKEKFVYLLLNKPKDYITSTHDPEGRKTVMELVKDACQERVYPVGRLDRNTTGLLLLTNDGDLAQKLAHPSFQISKIYNVTLDNAISDIDFQKLFDGVELEDGVVKVDNAVILTPDSKNIGLEIHSGKNRVVRRIFEKLGYDVVKLDRTMYAGLDKSELPRGRWRFLKEKEIVKIKYFD